MFLNAFKGAHLYMSSFINELLYRSGTCTSEGTVGPDLVGLGPSEPPPGPPEPPPGTPDAPPAPSEPCI